MNTPSLEDVMQNVEDDAMESPQPVEATGTYDPRPNNSHSRVEYRTASTGGRIGRIGRI